MVRYNDLTETDKQRCREVRIINGCGPKIGWVNWLVPDVVFGLHIEEDCDHHDFNYWLGHTEADRVKADWQFYERLRGRARRKTESWWWRWMRPIYYTAAWAYYRAVRWLGAKFFYYGPSERTREDLDAVLTGIDG